MNQKVSGLLHSQIVLVIVISRLVVLLSREGGKQERGTGGRGHCGADVLFFSLQASKAAVWASLQVRGKASSLLTSSTAKHPSRPVRLIWRSDRLAGGHLYMFTVCSDWQPEGWRAQTQSADSPHFCCTCHRMHSHMTSWVRSLVHMCVFVHSCVCNMLWMLWLAESWGALKLTRVLLSCCCCCLILTHQTQIFCINATLCTMLLQELSS